MDKRVEFLKQKFDQLDDAGKFLILAVSKALLFAQRAERLSEIDEKKQQAKKNHFTIKD